MVHSFIDSTVWARALALALACSHRAQQVVQSLLLGAFARIACGVACAACRRCHCRPRARSCGRRSNPSAETWRQNGRRGLCGLRTRSRSGCVVEVVIGSDCSLGRSPSCRSRKEWSTVAALEALFDVAWLLSSLLSLSRRMMWHKQQRPAPSWLVDSPSCA